MGSFLLIETEGVTPINPICSSAVSLEQSLSAKISDGLSFALRQATKQKKLLVWGISVARCCWCAPARASMCHLCLDCSEDLYTTYINKCFLEITKGVAVSHGRGGTITDAATTFQSGGGETMIWDRKRCSSACVHYSHIFLNSPAALKHSYACLIFYGHFLISSNLFGPWRSMVCIPKY